jgi:hypothetical protein
MTTATSTITTVRPVIAVVDSERTLEGGGFDEHHPWPSPLLGALRASNFVPGKIVPSEDRALRAIGRRTGKPIC